VKLVRPVELASLFKEGTGTEVVDEGEDED